MLVCALRVCTKIISCSDVQSQHLYKYIECTYSNNIAVDLRTERREGKPLPHMLSQEREEGEFLGVGGA